MAQAADWFQANNTNNNSNHSNKPDLEAGNTAGGGSIGLEALGSNVAASVASSLYASTTQKADSWFGGWFNIEHLKPYFDVDGLLVLKRFAYSLLPSFRDSTANPNINAVSIDLYGPCILVFTLVVLLHYSLWHNNQAYHLSSSFAFATSFWTISSAILAGLCYLFGTSLGLLQTLAYTGYALFAVCVSLVLRFIIVIPPVTLVLCALSSLSLSTTFYRATSNTVKALPIALTVFGINFLMNVYISYWIFN